jgi:hypothetical protein
MKSTKTLLMAALFVAGVVTTQAATLNYDPLTPAPAPVLDAGWAYDQIDAAFTDSEDSPYAYALGAPAMFAITDDFVPGDTYFVYDFGSLILTTTLTGQPFGGGVGGPAYQWGSVLLGAGAHLLTVQGDGFGGVPAGLYTRLDSLTPPVPDGGSLGLLSALLWAGFLGLNTLRRKIS